MRMKCYYFYYHLHKPEYLVYLYSAVKIFLQMCYFNVQNDCKWQTKWQFFPVLSLSVTMLKFSNASFNEIKQLLMLLLNWLLVTRFAQSLDITSFHFSAIFIYCIYCNNISWNFKIMSVCMKIIIFIILSSYANLLQITSAMFQYYKLKAFQMDLQIHKIKIQKTSLK